MTNKRIQQLPVHLANQIAAGEVVERPASVLKEILENSLDAGSTQIEITLERGGVGLIQVQDNGVGICKDDLTLALAPHATSKIATLSDLEGVISYGFRGEALASIGSVSRLKLSSSINEQETGFCIQIEGRDRAPTLSPVPKRQGTCVEVRDLFYNTPARRKFLKSEKTELSYLEEVFKRIALSQPHVAFKFQAIDKTKKQLPACKSLEAQTRRVAVLCGKSFVNQSYYLEAESNGLKLRGWLGKAAALRAQADLQYFYVNGRIVRDKVISHAIRQAYQKICLPGRYPAYVLYFELDPCAVDVNVHPTKHEVRFRETRIVHAFLSYAIQEGLEFNQGLSQPAEEQAKPNGQDWFEIQNNQDTNVLESINKKVSHRKRTEFDFWADQPLFVDTTDHEQGLNIHRKEVSEFLVDTKPQIPEPAIVQSNQLFGKEPNIPYKKLLVVLGGEILLAENNNELMVIDLKKLQQKMLYRQFCKAYHHYKIPKRPLLIPKSIIVGVLAEKAESEQIDWDKLGFEWNQVGNTTVLVRAVPKLFGANLDNLNELLQKLLIQQETEDCIQIMADHWMGSTEMTLEEAKMLLQDFENLVHQAEISKTEVLSLYKQMPLVQLRQFFLQA